MAGFCSYLPNCFLTRGILQNLDLSSSSPVQNASGRALGDAVDDFYRHGHGRNSPLRSSHGHLSMQHFHIATSDIDSDHIATRPWRYLLVKPSTMYTSIHCGLIRVHGSLAPPEFPSSITKLQEDCLMGSGNGTRSMATPYELRPTICPLHKAKHGSISTVYSEKP